MVKKPQTNSGRRQLFIWIMEPNLQLVTFEQVNNQQRSVMKVMFKTSETDCEFIKGGVDQEIQVPEIIIEKGLKHLITNQSMIPLSQRHDSNLDISYIDLSSVLLSKS